MFRRKSRIDRARDSVSDNASDLLDQAGDTWSEQVVPALGAAYKKAQETAQTKALPALDEARKSVQSSAAPVLEDVSKRLRDDVVPAVVSALTDARDKAQEAAQPYLDEGGRRGAAAAAALRGEVDAPKKRGRWKKFLLAGGLIGVGAYAFSKLRNKDSADPWQSSYTPPAPPSPAPKPADKPPAPAAKKAAKKAPAKKAAEPHDGAGATPGEAASDDAAENGPRAVTTPDDPATSTDVSGEPDPQP